MSCDRRHFSRQATRLTAQITLLLPLGCLLPSQKWMQTAIAQESSGINLPPPPPPAPLQPAQPLPILEPGNIMPVPGERVFQAPVANPAPANLSQYRVYVNGDSPLLLQEVKRVEPRAFFQQLNGRRVIQVGAFSTEANARQQMAVLAAQGFATQMTTGAAGSVVGDSARGYYVVIPGDRSRLPEIRGQAIRLGVQQTAISLRDRPLGPHVAVGPFSQRQEAETLERHLRDKGNLDARLYFDH